jgi:DGQHR domain-containing protein
MQPPNSTQTISVIVPRSPFVRSAKLQNVKHCLAALDVEKLMQWWPGTPHAPNRDAKKVREIQRSLDWKRVAQIAAYLLQDEIVEAPEKLDECFRAIYEPTKLEPGREWPPKVSRVVGFERSEYPTFSNVLLHVNGATVEPLDDEKSKASGKSIIEGAANLKFDENSKDLHFSVIDGQHRINGAYFAIYLLRKKVPAARWDIPSDLFIDLDAVNAPPKHQAQIFIDVNFYQKKVDRSLVADLFPTARGGRNPLDDKERAQDIGRRLMLDVGPLVGMIQIPGIKYGVKDVVTLATLNSAIEDVLDPMRQSDINSLEEQTSFIAQCLDAWLESSGRKQEITSSERLDSASVVYQGRVLVSALSLMPACLLELKKRKVTLISKKAAEALSRFFHRLIDDAGLLKENKFVSKEEFKKRGYLGSGGIGRFRDMLWSAASGAENLARITPERRAEIAADYRNKIYRQLAAS